MPGAALASEKERSCEMAVGQRRDGRITLCLVAAACWLPGCESGHRGAGFRQHESHSSERHGGAALDFYVRNHSDPDWLADAARFHGHLGPWVTAGAMIGRDAVKHLGTPGHWKIEVICWMPPEKQRTPFSCILDGLQVASGATWGKRNIRLAYSPEVVRDNQPVVYVIRHSGDEHPREGLVYHLTDELTAIMAGISPDRLEKISREIASRDVDELFEVKPMTTNELASGRP